MNENLKYLQNKDAKIEDLPKLEKIESIAESRYIPLFRASFVSDNRQFQWDFARSFDSVAVLLFNTSINSFIFVKQFRANVFFNNDDGSSLELCAGLIDKENKSIEEIAIEEVMEECGYQIKTQDLQKIGQFQGAIGTNTSKLHLYYALIDENMHVKSGGGIDNEDIIVIKMLKEEAYTLNSQSLLENNIFSTSIYLALLYFEKHEKTILSQKGNL